MIESYLTQAMVIRGETALGDYLRTGQTDFGNIRKEAFTDLMSDCINRGIDIKRLCKRLYLESTALTKTAAYDGVISDQDYAQRMRLIIPVTANTGDAVFTLQGTDDEGVNYFDIALVSDDGTSGTTVTITDNQPDDYSYLLTSLYKKYRLKLISIGTTITYSKPYVIEEIYTTLHREKTRSNIYRSLISDMGDDFKGKYDLYQECYNKLLTEAKMVYDVGDDEEITEDEAKRESQNIVFN